MMTGTIELNGAAGRHARNWGEVTVAQARMMAPVLLGADAVEMRRLTELSQKGKGKNAERIDAANAAFMAQAMQLLQMVIDPKNGIKFMREFVRLGPEHYAAIIGVEDEKVNPVKWCFRDGPTRQLMPEVKVGGVTYHGPKDFLGGVAFGEYLAIQERYKQWLGDRTKVRLSRLMASMYRPERTDVARNTEEWLGDRREPFNGKVCDGRAAQFMQLAEADMLLCVLYWQGCHAQMRKKWPLVFQGVSGNDSDPGEVILQLAGSVRKTDVQDAANAPVLNVMVFLNMNAKKDRKR